MGQRWVAWMVAGSLFLLGCMAKTDPMDQQDSGPDGGRDGGKVDAGRDGGVYDSGMPILSPSVRGTDPKDGATFVNRDTAVNVDLFLPNPAAGVDNATISTDAVKLYRVSDHAAVPGTVNTSGGGDAIVFQSSMLLGARETYGFEITPELKDTAGASFLPFAMTFTTGDYTRLRRDPRYQFDLNPTAVFLGPPIASLVFGPDGRLYATGLDGVVRRWTVVRSAGLDDGTLTQEEDFAPPELAGNALIGLTFQPGIPNVIWITNNAPLPVGPDAAPDFSGKVSRIFLGPSGGFDGGVADYVVGLPRSAVDHLTNSLAFGPDGALYLTQGSNSAMGAPDPVWFFRPEHLLNASLLRLDLTLVAGLPLDVTTELSDGGVPYDPLAPGAPLTIYGSGIRNAYDLVWHSSGHLFAAANGSAAGGNTPASPDGGVPALNGVRTQDDFLFDVVPGGYYGHPNPTVGHYVLNGGNPTAGLDTAEVVGAGDAGYPVGTLPDPAWRGSVLNFGRNRSPDGTIEYQSTAFGGALNGYLLVVEYSGGDDILAIPVGRNGVVDGGVIQVASGLSDPVDLIEDPNTGNLYVAQLVNGGTGGGAIVLLRPHL